MKAKSFFKSSKGSLIFALLMTIVMLILHVDKWNWGGDQRIFFGWMPQEFLYRVVFLLIIVPLLNYIIMVVSWPEPKRNDEKRR